MDNRLLTAVVATAEIYGRNMSPLSAEVFLEDLAGYPEDAVLKSLSRCRRELRTFPTVADILARIDDGRPGVEQAWAMLPKHEADSVVWTTEMAEAHGVVRGMIESDLIAARMAFKETYLAAVARARDAGKPVQWTASLGHDKGGREAALRDAIEKGRLSIGYVRASYPEIEIEGPKRVLLPGPREEMKALNFGELLEQIKKTEAGT